MNPNPKNSAIDLTHMAITYADIGDCALLKPGDGPIPAVLILPLRMRPKDPKVE